MKLQLYQLCREQIEERIKNIIHAIQLAKESAEGETKSSAGDKYETGRAMMQQEIENQSRQLVESKKLQQALSSIDVKTNTDVAALGSLVITDGAAFYLSVSLGRLKVEGEDYFAISPLSPIGALLSGKKKGDTFSFNGKQIRITDII
ncbi:3-oxoacyl-ACP synthase [Fulvivirga sp. M361]|nr:3-oxoacyl-ACP synthase [Fulvivirga sp. M361]